MRGRLRGLGGGVKWRRWSGLETSTETSLETTHTFDNHLKLQHQAMARRLQPLARAAILPLEVPDGARRF